MHAGRADVAQLGGYAGLFVVEDTDSTISSDSFGAAGLRSSVEKEFVEVELAQLGAGTLTASRPNWMPAPVPFGRLRDGLAR